MKFALQAFITLTLLQTGCSISSSQSFETLVTEAENRLQQLNTSDNHGTKKYTNFRSTVNENSGTLSFTCELEIDASSLGGDIIESSFDWRAIYQLNDEVWDYVTSERQVHHLSGAVAWESPRSDAEGNAEVLTILESLH